MLYSRLFNHTLVVDRGKVSIGRKQGRRKQCEAAGAAISKGHLLLNHHFSGREYLLNIYCIYGYSITCGYIMGRQSSTLNLNNFIRCTMLRERNKISKQVYMPDLALILLQLVKN
jgi:hypothetical protein